MMHGIYIHIPFCRKKCDYCGFFSVPAPGFNGRPKIPDAYIKRLVREFDERLDCRGLSADTIYFGGGTPSMLGAEQVHDMLQNIKSRAHLAAGAEISLEMNPEDVSREKIEGFRDAGVNRIVLGVQTLSERLHAVIGRSTGICTEDTLDVFFNTGGIQHCVDIITGIPSQTGDEFIHDIDTVAALRPSHISAYLLSIEKTTPLAKRLTYDRKMEADQLHFYGLTRSRLTQHGYDHYEISNYSMTGFRSRHNMKYWIYAPYIGFGPGSHSFVDNERSCNAMPVPDYINSSRTLLDHDPRGPESAAVEYMLTGLRLLSGLSIREMEMRLNYILPESVTNRIREAHSDGMIIMSGDDRGPTIRLSEKGILLADAVIYRIVESLLQSSPS